MSETETLQVSYKEFLAVLKEWEKYTFVLIKELAKEMPTSFEMDSYTQDYIEGPFADEVKLSDLSEPLWQSLEKGAERADAVHDEYFVKQQIDYFKSHSSYEDPLEIFAKLGKAAQLQIIQEDFLQVAISKYEENQKKKREERWAEEEREAELKEEQKRINKVEKEVRTLDNLECVFCSKELDTTAKRNYFCESEDEFITERVFLCCSSCLKEVEKKQLEPKFGRFANR